MSELKKSDSPAEMKRRIDHLVKEASRDASGYRGFCLGFVAGQAEKVALRVCPAAMIPNHGISPSYELTTAVRDVAAQYELYWLPVDLDSSPFREYWLCRADDFPTRDALRDLKDRVEQNFGEVYNSAHWHRQRAILCGIPGDRIDASWHLRGRKSEAAADQAIEEPDDRDELRVDVVIQKCLQEAVNPDDTPARRRDGKVAAASRVWEDEWTLENVPLSRVSEQAEFCIRHNGLPGRTYRLVLGNYLAAEVFECRNELRVFSRRMSAGTGEDQEERS